MSLPRYAEYKDSGVAWLGDVPAHWEVTPLKRLFKIVGGSTPKSDSSEFWDGDIVWVSPADLSKLDSLKISDSARKITSDGLASCGTTLVPTGSLVLSTRAPIGSLAIADTELCTNQGCKALVPTCASNSRFYAYMLLASTEQLNLRGKGTTFLELSADELGAFRVVTSQAEEQSIIATFLDRETGKIDALIAEQEKLLMLLAEKRQATISHAVIRGLNPNAPMKDSGVPWLGEVPTHWEVGALKRFWSVMDCKHLTAEFVEDGIPLASIREVQARFVELDRAKRTTETFYEQLIEGGREPREGDLIFSRNATVGEVAQVPSSFNRFAMGQDVCLLRRRRESMSADYMQYVIRSSVAVEQLNTMMIGSTFKRVNVEQVRNLTLPSPPESEQAAIGNYLVELDRGYEALAQEAICAIGLMKERRSALIAAAVTGKIDVRARQ